MIKRKTNAFNTLSAQFNGKFKAPQRLSTTIKEIHTFQVHGDGSNRTPEILSTKRVSERKDSIFNKRGSTILNLKRNINSPEPLRHLKNALKSSKEDLSGFKTNIGIPLATIKESKASANYTSKMNTRNNNSNSTS